MFLKNDFTVFVFACFFVTFYYLSVIINLYFLKSVIAIRLGRTAWRNVVIVSMTNNVIILTGLVCTAVNGDFRELSVTKVTPSVTILGDCEQGNICIVTKET